VDGWWTDDRIIVSLFPSFVHLNILHFSTTLKYAYCDSKVHYFLHRIIHCLLQCILQSVLGVCVLSFLLSRPLSTIPKNRFSLKSFIQAMLSLTIPSNDTFNNCFDASSNGAIDHSLDHSFNYSLFI
jgi:hypothetical protein